MFHFCKSQKERLSVGANYAVVHPGNSAQQKEQMSQGREHL